MKKRKKPFFVAILISAMAGNAFLSSQSYSCQHLAPPSAHDQIFVNSGYADIAPSFVVDKKKQADIWIKRLSNISASELQGFFHTTLSELLNIFASDAHPAEWNKDTWDAYREYPGTIKKALMADPNRIDRYLSRILKSHPNASRKTLSLLMQSEISLLLQQGKNIMTVLKNNEMIP